MNTRRLLKNTRLIGILTIAALGIGSSSKAQVSNYAFSQSSGTYSAIAGTTVAQASSSNVQDDNSFTVTLPFTFTFNGTGYTSAVVNTNGWAGFGAITATTNYATISSATTAGGFIAAFNRDLDGRVITTGNTTLGSTTVSGLASTTGIVVGAEVGGTGITGGTTVTAISGTSITLSAAATATGSATTITVYSGNISTTTIGTSPNRTFIIQWSNFSNYGSAGNAYNFQIRLAEGGGVATGQTVSIVYGAFMSASGGAAQVGLRGATNADYNDRTSTTSWTGTTAGTSNAATVAYSSSNVPPSGLTFVFTPPSGCSGTPTIGTASANTGAACASASFILSATGVTAATGITFQWQSRAAGTANPFTNITGATTNPYTVASQTTAQDYRLIVTCSNSSLTATSNTVTVTQSLYYQCYCTAGIGGASSGNSIDSVSIPGTTLNNNSPGTAATFYTAYPASGSTTATLFQGTTYTLHTAFGAASIASVWIDYDHSGTFDASEFTQITINGTINNTSITIPVSALTGLTGLRIRTRGVSNTNGATDACSSFGSGETEDYLITISTPPACSGTPAAGTLAATTGAACIGTSFQLNTTGSTTGVSGLTYQVQSSPTGANTFTTIGTSLPYTVASQSVATDYRVIITCATSSATNTSNIVTVTQNAPTNCYCIPTYTTGCAVGDNIDTFRLTGAMFTAINDLGTGCGTTANGYDNRSAQTPVVKLAQGTLHTGTISSSFGSSESVKIWIDFNDDGLFTSTDSVGIIASAGSSQTFFGIQIPATATLGNHRMRVRLAYATTAGLIDPCASYTYGETHDYTVNIVSCPAPAVSLGVDTFLCTGSSYTLNATGANTSTYLYSNGAATQSATVTAAGTYRVTVTTVAGCIGRDTVVVTSATTPTVNLGADTTICPGATITLNAGNAGSAYLYSNAATTQTTSITNGGTYTVRVTAPVTGCVGRDTIVIAAGSNPVVNLGADTTLCPAAAITLNAGNAGSTYLYSNAATTQTTTITAAGTYNVAVTNAAKCVGRDTIVISAGVNPVVNLGNDTVLCNNASLTLNAGNAGSTYVYSNSATTQTINVTAAGTYSVAVTNTGKCVGRDTIVVTTGTRPVVNLGADTSICPGAVISLNAGNAGSSYLFSNAATTQTTSVTASGTYSVRVTNAQGCVGRDTIIINQGNNPTVNLGPDTTICSGSSVTLNAGNAGSTYLYSNAATTQTTTVTSAGTYSVRVTNTDKCVGRDTINVSVSATPIVNLGADTVLCSGASLLLNAGNAGARYLYSTGAADTFQTKTVAAAGTYSVRVTSAAGCVGRDSIVVTTGTNPAVNLGADTAVCGNAALVLNAGNAGSTYLFSNAATTQTTTVTAPGTYSVRVITAAGCLGRDTIVIGVVPPPTVSTITASPTGPTVALTTNATGSTTYLWGFGDGTSATTATPTHTYTANGTYTVTLIVASPCGFATTTTTVVISGLGVNGPSLGAELSMFPNPAATSVTLDYQSTSVHMKSAVVLNSVGAVVLSKDNFASNKESIDINALPAGAYMVRIQTDAGAIVRRLQVVK